MIEKRYYANTKQSRGNSVKIMPTRLQNKDRDEHGLIIMLRGQFPQRTLQRSECMHLTTELQNTGSKS